MILFELKCSNEHNFEAWFKDGAAFDKQAKSSKIECPVCSDSSISKAPMAPSLKTSKGMGEKTVGKNATKEILKALETVQRHVEKNCDYVGTKFAEEAKAIHYGEAEERGIYGEATPQETSDLVDHEIPFQKIPWRQRKNS